MEKVISHSHESGWTCISQAASVWAGRGSHIVTRLCTVNPHTHTCMQRHRATTECAFFLWVCNESSPQGIQWGWTLPPPFLSTLSICVPAVAAGVQMCVPSIRLQLSLSRLNSVQFSINTLNGFGILNIYWYGVLIETSELHMYVGVFLCTLGVFFWWFLGTVVQVKRLRSYCNSTHTLKITYKITYKVINTNIGGEFCTELRSDQEPILTGRELGDSFCGFIFTPAYQPECSSDPWMRTRCWVFTYSVDCS